MRTLYLHIGHGKTGSSFLQSCFALSREAMQAHGRRYPFARHVEHAGEGKITSGNGRRLLRGLEGGWRYWRPVLQLRGGAGDVLLSNEDLFRALLAKGAAARLSSIARRAGFDRIEMLLFIRDPFDHLPSFHQQRVKRGGFAKGIDRSAKAYALPGLVSEFIRLYADRPEIGLTIRNYSRRKAQLVTVVEDWARLPHGTLEEPRRKIVNRGLTLAELELQRLLNERLGPSSALAADPLCERLPQVAAQHPAPSACAAERMAKRLAPDVAFVNAHVGAEDAYRVVQPRRAPPGPKTYSFTHAQLKVLADSISAEIRRRPLRL